MSATEERIDRVDHRDRITNGIERVGAGRLDVAADQPIGVRGHVDSARIWLALAVAVAADLIQIPLNLAFFPALASVVGSALDIPIETVDLVVDVVTAGVTTALLGFHWALLPTAVLELIPGLDVAPSWTACVMFVAWRRRAADTSSHSGAHPPPNTTDIDQTRPPR